jgi:hypothetical protein
MEGSDLIIKDSLKYKWLSLAENRKLIRDSDGTELV